MNVVYVFRQNTFFRKMNLAVTSAELSKGLLGRTTAGSGMFLMGATHIHTYQMKFSIDVVYANHQGIIIGLEEQLAPNRMGIYFENTEHVFEFNSGTIKNNRIKVGEQWNWKFAQKYL